MRVGQVRFQVFAGDHAGAVVPHLHGFIGSGEVIIEILADGSVRLSQAHGSPIRGVVTAREQSVVFDSPCELRDAHRSLESEPPTVRVTKSLGILPSNADLKQAEREARVRERTATKILTASYDPDGDAVVVQLSTGATIAVPRTLIPGLCDATPAMLTDLAINPGAESLWSDSVDDGVLLEQLLEIAAGADLLKVVGGRISGRQRSAAKAEASRANGAKGGRPSLTMGEFIRELDRTLHDLAPGAPRADRSDNPNPNAPASAYWHVGRREILSVKVHGRSDVQVRAKWPRGRVIERRIRTTADRLARELARELTGTRSVRRSR